MLPVLAFADEIEAALAGNHQFQELLPYFQAIRNRTSAAEAERRELGEVFFDQDERTIRRRIHELRNLLTSFCESHSLPFILSIEESRAGFPSQAQRASRNTFTILPNARLPDFVCTKWWSDALPVFPRRRPRTVNLVYTSLSDGEGDKILVGHWQFLKRLIMMLTRRQASFVETPSSDYRPDPNLVGEPLILIGDGASNSVIEQVDLPANLPLRISVAGITDTKSRRTWAAEPKPAGLHKLYALVSSFRSPVGSRIWMFESRHSSAMHGIGHFFTDEPSMASLASALGVSSLDEFPDSLQLVFSLTASRNGQLAGMYGDPQLELSVHGSASAIRQSASGAKTALGRRIVAG